MADIAAQSQLDHGGGFGIGYRPVGSPVSPRYTVTKLITNNGNGTATVTLTVTVKTNHGYIGTGYYLTLNFSCGGKSVSSLWKGDQASWAKNSTYSKSISIANVPLGTSTTASASLSVTIGKQSWQQATTGFTFNSTTYSGNQITGLPLGYTAAKFNSANNFTSTASSITVSITGGSSGTATKVAVSIGSTTIKTTSAVTGNITSISLDAADRTRIHNAVPNSTTATVTFVMTTQRSTSNTTVVGTATKTATVTIGSTIVPTLSGLTAAETGNRGSLTGNNFAVTYSRIKFTMGTQTAGTGASISSRKITFNGTTYDGATATTGAIGTSGNITATATITDSRGRTATKTLVCTMVSVPAHSFTAMSNFTHTDNSIPVTITQNSSLVYADVSLWLGATHLGTQSVTSSTTAFTLTSSMKSSLLARIPTSSATVTILAVSHLGSTEIGRTSRTSTCYISGSIVPAKPTVSVTDTNSSVTGLGLGAGYFVKGLSTVSLSMSNISAGSGATVSSRTISYGSSSYSYSSGSLPVGSPNTVGNISISGTVTDSRGRSTKSDTITRQVLDYKNPTLSGVSIFRSTSGGAADNDGTRMRINHTLGFQKLLGKNTLTLNIRVKNSSTNTWPASPTHTQTWTETQTPTTNTILTGAYPIDQSYDVEITVVDKAKRSVTAIGKLPTSEYPLVLGPNNVGVGKIPNASYTLDVGGDTRIDGDTRVEGNLLIKSHPAVFRQNIGLDIQKADYRRSVIAFAKTADGNSWCTGILNMHRVNGLQGVVTAHISIEKKYNASTIHSSILKFGAGESTSIRPCTFTYGGVKYGGVEVFIADAHFAHCELMVSGGNFTPFGLDYYDTRGTALNAEVNNSIEFSSPSQVGTLYHNGTSVGGSYTLPTASASILGGIKVGSNLSISSGVLSATNTTYGVATTGANGLMSAADKTKLNGIATGAGRDLIVSDVRDTNPTPDNTTNNKLTTFFNNSYGHTWLSGITVSGWNAGYQVWQLGAPSSNSTDEALKFRVGRGSSWNPWREVLTDASITTHGSGNNISYRFPNGLQISVIRRDHNSQAISTAWGSLYESGMKTGVAYSVAFNAEPVVTISVQGSNHAFVSSGGGSATVSPEYALLRPTSTTGNYRVKIIAIGRWK